MPKGSDSYFAIETLSAAFFGWWGWGFVPLKTLLFLVVMGSSLFTLGVILVWNGKRRISLLGAVLILLSAYALLPRAPEEVLSRVPFGGWISEARDAAQGTS